MASHSPRIELQNARANLDRAYENCPHWDYEDESGIGATCCQERIDALRRLLAAKRRVRECV